MSEPKAHVAVLVDFDALAGGASPAPAELATALLRYAAGVGRVTVARAYADWTSRPADALAVQTARLVPVLCPRGPAGEDRAHVRLVVDALEALYAGGEPDAFVLASGDARLLPLLHALRADGSDVLLVAPEAAISPDLRAEADTVATLEEVLGGAVGPASAPRAPEEAAVEEPAAHAPPPRAAHGPRPSRDRDGGPRSGPARGERERWGRDRDDGPPSRFGRPSFAPPALDFTNYDWSAFVKLIDELEHRLPFVGVRYLVNKVLGGRNCGVEDPRLKRDLINRAVDEGMLEMYEVGNVGERADPVTACRLDRKNPVVVGILGSETRTPLVPEHHEGATPEEGFVEGGLSLDSATADEEV